MLAKLNAFHNLPPVRLTHADVVMMCYCDAAFVHSLHVACPAFAFALGYVPCANRGGECAQEVAES